MKAVVNSDSWSAPTVSVDEGWMIVEHGCETVHEACTKSAGVQCSGLGGASQSMGWRRRFFKVLSQFPTSHLTWSQPSISFFSPLSLLFWIVNPTSTSTEESSHTYTLMITDDSFICSIWCSWSTCSVSYRLIGLCENSFVENLCLVHEEVM